MIPLPPRATRTYPLCPYTPHFRSDYLDPASIAAALEGISAAFVVTPDFLDEQRAMEILCAAAKSRKTLRQIVRILGNLPYTNLSDIPAKWRTVGVTLTQPHEIVKPSGREGVM